ncbi:AAA family ATPase [Lysobacter sp. A421]
MIAGLFLRNYRSYRATHFVPVSQTGANLSLFIGPNGVGKSTILDALDVLFNGGEWSVNTTAKRGGGLNGDDKIPFVAPVFLLDPEEVPEPLHESLTKLSTALDSARSSPAVKVFEEVRQKLLKKFPGAHVIVLGRAHNDYSRVFLGPYERDAEVRRILNVEGDDHFTAALGPLMQFVLERYAYFYIPVEADPLTYTKLEQLSIQKLLDEDIQNQIQKVITQKTIKTINKELRAFLGDIHEHLESYSYKNNYKESLTMRDLTAKVVEAFFSTKVLHKDGDVPVSGLSAGEKRRALIDVAYSFLRRRRDRNVRVVLAVDEPDASLHASACHDQFTKLASIVDLTTPKTQVLLTTHWYGFLPLATEGEAQSMSERDGELSITTIDLRSYRESLKGMVRESKGSLPVDVAIKSYNDLVQTIVAAVVRKDNPYTWIICEGLSDKIYLDHYFQAEVKSKRLRILPVGGVVDVKRVYDRLVAPLADDSYKVYGKVLCLIDTDAEANEVEVRNSQHLFFKRMVLKGDDVVLVDGNDYLRAPVTAIEDALEPASFHECLSALSAREHSLSTELAALLDANPLVVTSRVSASCMDFRDSDRRLLERLFATGEAKVDFAELYCARELSDSPPAWIEQVRSLLWPVSRSGKAKPRQNVVNAKLPPAMITR